MWEFTDLVFDDIIGRPAVDDPLRRVVVNLLHGCSKNVSNK